MDQSKAIETLAMKVEQLSALVAALQSAVMHMPAAEKIDFKAANAAISQLVAVTQPTLLLQGRPAPALMARQELERMKTVLDARATVRSAGQGE